MALETIFTKGDTMILYITGDLMFSSRVTARARERELPLQVVLPSKVSATISETPDISGLILDLETPGLNITTLVEEVRADTEAPIVAYGPHVQAEQLRRAGAAGCDVLTRGSFSSSIDDVLSILKPGS